MELFKRTIEREPITVYYIKALRSILPDDDASIGPFDPALDSIIPSAAVHRASFDSFHLTIHLNSRQNLPEQLLRTLPDASPSHSSSPVVTQHDPDSPALQAYTTQLRRSLVIQMSLCGVTPSTSVALWIASVRKAVPNDGDTKAWALRHESIMLGRLWEEVNVYIGMFSSLLALSR